MATNKTDPREFLILRPCAGCKSLERIQILNHAEFDMGSWTPENLGIVITHQVYCSVCCLDRNASGPFTTHADNRKEAVRRWNRTQRHNRLDEQEHDAKLAAHENYMQSLRDAPLGGA